VNARIASVMLRVITVMAMALAVLPGTGATAGAQTTGGAGECTSEWAVVPTPNPGRFNALSAVSTLSANDAWAVGSYLANRSSHPLILHWTGVWTSVTAPVRRAAALADVLALAPDDAWAVGAVGPGGDADPLILHWNGVEWGVTPSPSLPQGGVLESVSASGPNDVWAVGFWWEPLVGGGSIGRPLVERWDGTSWTIVDIPNGDEGGTDDLAAVNVVAPDDVWVAGIDYPATARSGHWDGQSWDFDSMNATGGEAIISALTHTPRGGVWAVGTLVHETSLETTLIERWTGTSWQVVPSPDPGDQSNLLDVDWTGDGLWAVGGFRTPEGPTATLAMRLTRDGWTLEPTPTPGINGYLQGISGRRVAGSWSVGVFLDRNGQRTLALRRCP
jgi:hypothetical protein